MSDVVAMERVGTTGLIALNNPPVNAASAALRKGVWDAVETLEAEPGIDIIALYGTGRSFIAGADIREFGKPPADPWLPALCRRIEECTTPVLSILHGAALGGGLEVALATHARIALPGIVIGLPEVTLGILPGAGGTQRTPRLIGIPAALELITSGKHISADTALSLGLVDRIADGPPAIWPCKLPVMCATAPCPPAAAPIWSPPPMRPPSPRPPPGCKRPRPIFSPPIAASKPLPQAFCHWRKGWRSNGPCSRTAWTARNAPG
ncbi:enoyl-CoA hydratase/isomerase family protein [Rhodophyticola sp. CCM32]|uniref:enoyl-CoA hydratase/isomerase family protein n=1 Tax=Rhodophyticola sp. CCM32 TaxID=2916397 RepID=UPI003083A125